MGARTTVRLVGNHLQNVAMLSGLNVGWPDSFKELFGWTRIFNIDLSAILLKLRLPTITQRLIFIGVSIALPLSLMLLTAIVFFSISSIVQITLGVCGIAILVLHTISFANPDILAAEYNKSVGSETVLWVGFAATFTVILYRLVRRKSYDVASAILWIGTVLFGLTLCTSASASISRRIVLSFFAVFLFVFTVLRARESRRVVYGLVVLAFMGVLIWASDKWSVDLPVQFNYVGWVVTALGGGAIMSRVASLLSSTAGSSDGIMGTFSRIRVKFQRLLDTGLLTLILFLMAMVYSPVITNALQLFVCETYKCPAGTAFNPYALRPESDQYTVAPEVFCEACNFTADCSFSTYELCPAWSSRRLLYDPATTCDDSSYMSFIAAAILVLIVFVVILQVMYVKVIDICTKVMCVKCKSGHQRLVMQFQEDYENAPIQKELEPPVSYDEKWEDTCLRVAPKASSLYDPYRFTLRYFILIESLYKTIEVLSTTFLSPLSPAASVIATSAHFVFFFLLVLTRPLADATEHWLSVLLSFCMVLDGLYAILMWQAPGVFGKDGWGWGVLFFNLVIPVVGGTYLLYVNARNQFCRKTIAEKKKEEEKEQEKAERKRREKEEKKMSKREKMEKRMEARRKEMEENLLKFEQAYAKGASGDASEELLEEEGGGDGKDGTKKMTKKSHKELKREQMSPSEKLAELLNGFTKKIILLYFAFMGIPLLCAALVFTLISGSITGNTNFVDASNLFDRSRYTTLNNYYSWDEFSATCCCFETEKFISRGSNITERWMCMNFDNATQRANGTVGPSFFRTRRDNAGNDGLPIRPLCGLHTVQDCVAQVQQDDAVKMQCEKSYVQANNISDFALSILW